MDSEQPSRPLFNIRVQSNPNVKDDEAFVIGVDDKGQVFASLVEDIRPPKKEKSDPLWDLEPHKIVFPEPVDPAEPNKFYINQDINAALTYLTVDSSGPLVMNTRLNGMWFDEVGRLLPPRITKNPELFIHKCCKCNVSVDFMNILCDKCSSLKTDTIVLDGDDIRQTDLILEI